MMDTDAINLSSYFGHNRCMFVALETKIQLDSSRVRCPITTQCSKLNNMTRNVIITLSFQADKCNFILFVYLNIVVKLS